MEGTLLQKSKVFDNGKVAPSSWTALASALGDECLKEEEASKDRWNKKEYLNYIAWMLDTVRIHKKYKLNKSTFKKVMSAVKWTDGLIPTFEAFHAWNAITVIVSGGFKYHADQLQAELKIDHSFCGCEYFFDESTGLIKHFNLLPADVEGKVDFMKLITKEYGVDPSECAFIGDGMNDVALAKVVGCSIAFNAQRELKEVASCIVEQPDGKVDFTSVIQAIENFNSDRQQST